MSEEREDDAAIFALRSLRRIYEHVPRADMPQLENDFLEVARQLCEWMSPASVGLELRWLEEEIESRRDGFAEAHGVFSKARRGVGPSGPEAETLK